MWKHSNARFGASWGIWGWLLVLSYTASGSAGAGPHKPEPSCRDPEELEVARIDELNQRLFLVADCDQHDADALMAIVRRGIAHVDRCHGDWSHRFSLSIMAEAELAGYKDEPEIRPLLLDGSWVAGYLAEYSGRRKVLTLHPLQPSLRREIDMRPESNPSATAEQAGSSP